MKFFVLDNPSLDGGVPAEAITDCLSEENARTGEAPRCPFCSCFIGSLPLLPPIRMELETWGSKFGDIVHGVGGDILLSERFMDAWKAAGLVGLEVVGPAEIVKHRRHRKLVQPMPRYFCCRVQRGRAVVDDLQSGIVRDEPWSCAECRGGGGVKRAKRIVLEAGSWAGEDLFGARGLSGRILASERFKAFCVENRFTNCVLVPAEEFHFDFYPWEKTKK